MKLLILTLGMAALAFAENTYEDVDVDLSEVLGNDKLVVSYAKCLLNQAPCTPDVKKLKDKLPEALETRCAKCSEKQKKMAKQVISEVKTKHPEIWKELAAFYDPQGKYQESFEEFLKS